ncbi:MAG: hypothetical protein ACK4N5_12265 [Myxococcales bacterium]
MSRCHTSDSVGYELLQGLHMHTRVARRCMQWLVARVVTERPQSTQ